MRRPLFILIASFLLLAGAAFVFIFLVYKEETSFVSEPVTFPSGDSQGVSGTETDRITIRGREGMAFSIPDITKAPGTVAEPYDADQYVVAEYCLTNEGCTDANQTDGFRIVFDRERQSFDVLLLAEPLKESRMKATQFLALRLELTPAQVCSLNTTVGTINAVNGFYAGEELGLQGCPGAVQLP